jgi:alpha-glucosidase (family GH31 glycosyl hydrolase)
LMPYIYSYAAEGHANGLPLMRSLAINWPRDEKAVMTSDAYTWGDHMLVAPVFEKNATSRNVYLPEGMWWNFESGTEIVGGKTISANAGLGDLPLFVRAGAVIPFGPVKQYTGEHVEEPITLRVYPGADGHFTWYDDDGVSYAHERGQFMRADCRWDDAARTLTISRDTAGRLPLPDMVRVELTGGDSRELKLGPNGASAKF